MSWYDDVEAMEGDDAYLNAIVDRLIAELSSEARKRVAGVHIYPSRQCTYTINKQRIFVRVRDPAGDPYPECVIRHVLLHELAHVVNPTVGHDPGFRQWLRWLRGQAPACAEAVPLDFNPCL